jgi:hypothetical protein
VRLTELDPRWLEHDRLFIFKCPCCRDRWLTCKNFAATRQQIFDILHDGLGETWNEIVVPPKPETAWLWSTPSFDVMTVAPSIDASESGHWHGFITAGEIK